MKGTFQRYDAALAGALAGRRPRQFQRAFHGFGAAVGKKRSRHAGELAKFFCQLSLIFVVVKIGNVDELRGLPANDFHYARMRMTQGIYAQSAQQIEIAAAIVVPDKDAFAALDSQWIAIVSGQ